MLVCWVWKHRWHGQPFNRNDSWPPDTVSSPQIGNFIQKFWKNKLWKPIFRQQLWPDQHRVPRIFDENAVVVLRLHARRCGAFRLLPDTLDQGRLRIQMSVNILIYSSNDNGHQALIQAASLSTGIIPTTIASSGTRVGSRGVGREKRKTCSSGWRPSSQLSESLWSVIKHFLDLMTDKFQMIIVVFLCCWCMKRRRIEKQSSTAPPSVYGSKYPPPRSFPASAVCSRLSYSNKSQPDSGIR
jgi:hypothetical protein